MKIAPSTSFELQTDKKTEMLNIKLEEEHLQIFWKYDREEHFVEFEVAFKSSFHSTTMQTLFYVSHRVHPSLIKI